MKQEDTIKMVYCINDRLWITQIWGITFIFQSVSHATVTKKFIKFSFKIGKIGAR